MVSLRLRITLWSGGLMGLLMVLLCLTSYAIHSRTHYDDLDTALASAAEHFAEEYLAAPENLGNQSLGIAGAPSVGLRVFDASGDLVRESPNAAAFPAFSVQSIVANQPWPPFDFIAGLAPPMKNMPAGHGAFGLFDEGGVRWRVYVLPLEGHAGALAAVAPLDRIDLSVENFRRIILVLAIVGATLTFVAGWLVAGRALRPVGVMTASAGTIARSRLFSQRVPVADHRDELGRLGTTFNAMLASLEQAYQAQNRFVGDASHELRAPLTAIQANLDLLERNPDLAKADRNEAISEASREAKRLTQLVADLLALARADSGVSIRRRPVELDRLVLEVISEVRHITIDHMLVVNAIEPTILEGDRDRLKQLLLILVDNATKYSPPSSQIGFSLRRTGNKVVLQVDDQGVGIPPDSLPRVFERFYRADPARARDPGGTGLGLSIAQWIVDQHGGQIAITSELGFGTTVVVSLPIHGQRA